MDDRILRAESWLKQHERLVIVFLVLLVTTFGINKYINYAADQSHAQAASSAQLLAQQQNENKILDEQRKEDAQQYQQTMQAMQQQIAALNIAIVTRNAQVIDQQHKNNISPLPEVAARMKNLAGLDDSEIQVSASGVSVSESGVRKTTNQLEEVPVLRANLSDTQQIADNRQKEIDKADTLIGSLNTQVDGLKLETQKQENACKDQVADIKKQARRSKRNWFLRGAATGAAVAFYIALHFGI